MSMELTSFDPDCDAIVSLPFSPEVIFSPINRFCDYPLPKLLKKPPSRKADVLIVGGGIWGTAIYCLLKQFLSDHASILVVDKHITPAFQLASRASCIFQRTMRSGYQDHIAPSGAMSLLDFGFAHLERLTQMERQQLILARNGQRSVVPLDVFLAHVAHTAYSFDLCAAAFTDTALRIEITGQNCSCTFENNQQVEASSVVIAGGEAHSRKPTWLANASHSVSARVHHVFETTDIDFSGETVLIVGGGQSAASWMLGNQAQSTIWLTRSEPVFQCFDRPSRYFRHDGFSDESSWTAKGNPTKVYSGSRGTIMPEFAIPIQERIKSGVVQPIYGDTIDGLDSMEGRIRVSMKYNGTVEVDRIVLATGISGDLQSDPEIIGNAKLSPVIRVGASLRCKGMPPIRNIARLRKLGGSIVGQVSEILNKLSPRAFPQCDVGKRAFNPYSPMAPVASRRK